MLIKNLGIPALLVILLLFQACNFQKNLGEKEEANANVRFETYKKDFVDQLWRINPEWASSNGFHRYDSVLVIPTPARRQAVAQSYRDLLKELEQFKPENLSVHNRTDQKLIENYLQYSIWQDSIFRSYEWDPSQYNVSGSIAEILNGRYDNLDTRLRAISAKLANVPVYYETAVVNLKNPTVEHTRLAVIQNKGGLTVFGKALLDSVETSGLQPSEKDLLRQRIQTSRLAMDGYIRFLESELLPKLRADSSAGRSFRIGKQLFEQKFAYDIQSRYTAEEIYRKALAHKTYLQRQMKQTSAALWPKYFGEAPPADSLEMVRKMIGKLSEKHVPQNQFVNAVRKQIPELVKFVNEKQLLTLDPSKPLVVRETPLYMRGGGAGASVSAPGPYDTAADTYYNVTPLDHYTPAQAESYLREYNDYTLQILNIHEAIPGHYAQLVYSNQSPSLIKAILGNGAMVEGWAVYTERMMLENGYQNSPEMWLMYYKWNLRVTLNAIVDYGVHVLGFTEEQVLDLLRNEGFQEEAEAQGKWTRAKLSQVQLSSYFTGFTEIYDLREELKQKQGEKFDLKEFHEQFLSYGSAPVKYIREMMLASLNGKDATGDSKSKINEAAGR